MKIFSAFRLGLILVAGFFLLGAPHLRAQDAPLTPPQVDQLLGPIALYPDALVALILPASSMPGDVVLAARYISDGGNPDQIDYQPWNDSIKALARYPVLIKWLDENLAWTQQLGQTFLAQPDEVMNAVRRLRVRARATGALVSNAQQKVVLDGDIIRIVPAQPDTVYVPYYDPNVVYAPPPVYYGYPYITYGVGFPVGIWLSYDVDWHHHNVWVGDSHHNWHDHGHGDWDHHYGPGNSGWHQWKAPAARPPNAPNYRRPPADSARPGALPGAPTYPRHDNQGHDGNRPDGHRDGSPPQASGAAPNAPAAPNSPDHHRHPEKPSAAPKPEAVPNAGPAIAVPTPRPNATSGHGQMPMPVPLQNSPGPVPTRTTQPGTGGPPIPRPVPQSTIAPAPVPAPPPPQNPKDNSQPGKDPQSNRVQN